MGEPAVKKDGRKKVIAGHVNLEVHTECYRRAAIDRRPVSQWLELVLEEYLRTHPIAGPTLVTPGRSHDHSEDDS